MNAHKDRAWSTVAVAPSPATSGTSLTVATGDGATKFDHPPFKVTICPINDWPTLANSEIATCTAQVGDVLTLTRTGERAILVGDQIVRGLYASDLEAIEAVIDPTNSPTFSGLTLSGLTPSRLVMTDGAKAIGSVALLSAWVKGTASQIVSTDDGNGAVTLSLTGPYAPSSFTANGVLYGNASSAVQALAVNATSTWKFLAQANSGAPIWTALVASDLPSNGATPSASVGLAAIAGSASTWMRSDAAPALSPAIAPTMTADWIWQPTADSATNIQWKQSAGTTGMIWNSTLGRMGIGIQPISILHINGNANNATVVAMIASKGRGTTAAPLRTQSADAMGGFNNRGWVAADDSSTATLSSGGTGQFLFRAAEAYTNGGQGTNFEINLAPVGGTTVATRFWLSNGGYAQIQTGLLIGKNDKSTLPTYDMSFDGQSTRTLGMERQTTSNTAGLGLSVLPGGATTSATDKAGGDLTLKHGISTGTATASVKIQTSAAGSTGTADNAFVTTFEAKGNKVGFFATAVAAQQTVTGSRGGNAALANLLTALAAYGLIVDSSSA